MPSATPFRRFHLLAGLVWLVLPSSGAAQIAAKGSAKSEITIAAASNLSGVFQKLGPDFEAETGIHPVFSFASTAQLARQIENSAPFDVFAAADSEHVAELDQKHLLLPGTRAIYATGVLALWIPPSSAARLSRVDELTSADVKVIAIAKPELAPYGQAAVETLQHLKIWEQVKSKVVYAENINMATQYGSSGNADAVLTAYSLVLKEPGKVIRVDENLHRPISQELGIVANSAHPDDARKFVNYLLTGQGRSILADFGYRVPSKAQLPK
jgi:molybdate transport system substrate-binding protein